MSVAWASASTRATGAQSSHEARAAAGASPAAPVQAALEATAAPRRRRGVRRRVGWVVGRVMAPDYSPQSLLLAGYDDNPESFAVARVAQGAKLERVALHRGKGGTGRIGAAFPRSTVIDDVPNWKVGGRIAFRQSSTVQ